MEDEETLDQLRDRVISSVDMFLDKLLEIRLATKNANVKEDISTAVNSAVRWLKQNKLGED